MDKRIQALDRLSPSEQKAVLKSIKGKSPSVRKHEHIFGTDYFKFGYYSDPHVGHKEFREKLWHLMLEHFRHEGITEVYSPGDNCEGMSGRPGHVYELSHIGAQAQIGYAAKLINLAPEITFHIIDGNHDEWFQNKADIGLVVGEELALRCPNVDFLGQMEADVILAKGVTMKLYHGRDGTAYADSYKVQKLIESFQGGEKPSIVLSGHYHKQVSIFRRNVFGFECGTLCGQTPFMRGKKLPAHMGFGIIEVWVAKRGGVERLRHEFFPYYD